MRIGKLRLWKRTVRGSWCRVRVSLNKIMGILKIYMYESLRLIRVKLTLFNKVEFFILPMNSKIGIFSHGLHQKLIASSNMPTIL